MSVIQASSAGVKDMADGSLRITFEFDPRFAKEAYSLFGARGTSCAIAALTQAASLQAAQKETTQESKDRPGQLCVMACTFCADKKFWQWIEKQYNCDCTSESQARDFILDICIIESRKELDTNQSAAATFHTEIRKPFLAWRAA